MALAPIENPMRWFVGVLVLFILLTPGAVLSIPPGLAFDELPDDPADGDSVALKDGSIFAGGLGKSYFVVDRMAVLVHTVVLAFALGLAYYFIVARKSSAQPAAQS